MVDHGCHNSHVSRPSREVSTGDEVMINEVNPTSQGPPREHGCELRLDVLSLALAKGPHERTDERDMAEQRPQDLMAGHNNAVMENQRPKGKKAILSKLSTFVPSKSLPNHEGKSAELTSNGVYENEKRNVRVRPSGVLTVSDTSSTEAIPDPAHKVFEALKQSLAQDATKRKQSRSSAVISTTKGAPQEVPLRLSPADEFEKLPGLGGTDSPSSQCQRQRPCPKYSSNIDVDRKTASPSQHSIRGSCTLQSAADKSEIDCGIKSIFSLGKSGGGEQSEAPVTTHDNVTPWDGEQLDGNNPCVQMKGQGAQWGCMTGGCEFDIKDDGPHPTAVGPRTPVMDAISQVMDNGSGKNCFWTRDLDCGPFRRDLGENCCLTTDFTSKRAPRWDGGATAARGPAVKTCGGDVELNTTLNSLEDETTQCLTGGGATSAPHLYDELQQVLQEATSAAVDAWLQKHGHHEEAAVSALVIALRRAREHNKSISMETPVDETGLVAAGSHSNQQLLRDTLMKKKAKMTQRIGSKPLAPALNDNLQFHVFFLYHRNDREWAMNVMEKLESPPLGFQCCCHERDFDCNGSLQSSTHVGIKNSQKTVLVLTPDFMADVWSHDDMQLLSEMDVLLIQKDMVLVMLQECDIPHVLGDVSCVDTAQDDWWGKLLAHLISSEDTPMTEETALSLSSSLVGLNPNLQSGHLLHSAKSRCRCCGKEVVDPTELPDELIAHGIQIPADEYKEAISHLMCDNKFRCHVWCYNVPAAMLFFALLLALCLAVIPLIEAKLVFHGAETGLEFVHAGVVWLCALTLYMVVMQLSKRKMKGNTYKRLTFVNTILIKYNLLAGVENLGLADCNKYYLHFFYFEIGPCLAYLQELMVNIEEYSACFRNQVAESGDVTIEMDCDDTVTIGNDQSRVLDNTNMTNTSMQNQAENLILDHSGEYITMLITKRLDRPRRQRHVRDSLCLCQFVEQRVYKMIV